MSAWHARWSRNWPICAGEEDKALRRVSFDSTGLDRVEFLVSANPGEPLRPLARVASGGETARLMLALKTVLSHADETPTLIFDEIDVGIGGRTGPGDECEQARMIGRIDGDLGHRRDRAGGRRVDRRHPFQRGQGHP